MSKPMPTVTIRLPVSIMERIDQELAGPAYKFQIARPSRSDWIRNAIELRIGELDKKQAKKKRLAKRCDHCQTKLTKVNAGPSMSNGDGSVSRYCVDCQEKRLLK